MIINGDCLIEMKKMGDCSIDFIVTDPPYGIGFMNKKFDRFKDQPAFNPEVWKEGLRICKPGSMLAAFGGDRTHHHLMMALEQAGWEIRTCIYWIFGTGFPKSHNFGKKLSPEWHGYGTALKSSSEIIIIAMKPLDGTFANNAEKWGLAGINIDDSRIEGKSWESHYATGLAKNKFFTDGKAKIILKEPHNKGRWPSQIIFDEESSNLIGESSRFFYCAKASSKERNAGLEGLPLKEIKRMGNMKACDNQRPNNHSGCKEMNTHPTIKPISLMKYILNLLAPPGNPIVLDPFAGSGSTLLAAKELGFRYIGIEIEKEYFDICEKRINAE